MLPPRVGNFEVVRCPQISKDQKTVRHQHDRSCRGACHIAWDDFGSRVSLAHHISLQLSGFETKNNGTFGLTI